MSGKKNWNKLLRFNVVNNSNHTLQLVFPVLTHKIDMSPAPPRYNQGHWNCTNKTLFCLGLMNVI